MKRIGIFAASLPAVEGVFRSAVWIALLLLGGTIAAHAATYTNNVAYTPWTNAAAWNGTGPANFTTAPSTGEVSTIIRITSAASSVTNNYPSVVLNQLINGSYTIYIYGTGTLFFVNNGATMPAISNSAGATIHFNEALNVSTTTTFRSMGNGGITVNSNITGSGSLVITNTSTGFTTLSGSNSYSGGTLISTGILKSTAGFALGTGAVSVASGGILQFGSSMTNNSGIISGAGMVEIAGTSVIRLWSSNAYSGGTLFSSGSARAALGDDNALGSGPLYFTGAGSLSSTGNASRTLANNLVFSNNATLGTTVATGDPGLLNLTGRVDLAKTIMPSLTINSPVILAGVISNGGFTKLGASTLTISNAGNLYAGGTTNSAGAIALGADNVLGSGSLVMNGGILQTADGTARALTNALVFALNPVFGSAATGNLTLGSPFINLGTGARMITISNALTILQGVLTNTASLIKAGPGSLMLSNASTYSGGTILSNGMLVIGSDFALGAGLLTFSGGSLSNAGNRVVDNVVNLGSVATINVGGADSLTLNGAITNSGALTKAGSGSLMLSNANTYSGGTILSNGMLQIGNDLALGTGLLTFSGGSLSNAGSHAVANAVNLGSSATISVGGTDVLTLSGAITNTGGLTKLDTGTLILSGANTYSGGTILSNGTLSVGAVNALPGAGAVTVAGGVYDLGGFTVTNGAFAAAGGGVVSNGSLVASSLTFNPSVGTPVTSMANLNGGSFSKLGAGTLMLGGSNSFSTFTTVGDLDVPSGMIQASGAVTIGNAEGSNSTLFLHGSGSFVGPTGVLTRILIGAVSNSTGTVIVADGGSLNLTNKSGASNTSYISLGEAAGALGSLIVSNGGTVRISTASGNPYFDVGRVTGARGELLISGGSVDVNSIFHIGAQAGSTGLVSVVGGRLTATNNLALSEYLKVGTYGFGTMLISNQGVVVADQMAVGYGGGGVGLLLITEGGRLEMTGNHYLQTGLLLALGTISNVSGGTIQFTTNAPLIGSGTRNAFVKDSAIEFKGVDAASLTVLNNWNYSGANTLRMIGATNAAISYSFTNGGRFSTLELAGDYPMWQGASLLIGNGGTLRASNTFATVGAVLTNAGTVSVINGQVTYLSNVVLNGGLFLTQGGTNNFTRGLGMAAGSTLTFTTGTSRVDGAISNSGTINAVNANVTFGGPVVISGGYISDPSTNIFTSNVTVTSSGYLVGGLVVSNGDQFVFEKDLLMLSTNRLFNVSQAGFLFTNSTSHLLSISNSGALNIGQGYASFSQVASNFAIGTLSIAVGDKLTIAGNKDSRTNALYVGWLDIQGLGSGSLLTNNLGDVTNTLLLALSLPNVNLYYDVYDPRNNWLTAQLPPVAGAGYDLWGGGVLLPIPEPSPFLAVGTGLALLAFLRRRKAA